MVTLYQSISKNISNFSNLEIKSSINYQQINDVKINDI